LLASINELAKAIDKAHIIFLPGGFSAGDEPDGSAKFIVNVFHNEKVKKATMALIKRKGLILGICNGFQALIKLGLVPYGKILDMNESMPTLTFNKIRHHMSRLIRTKVVSNKSP
ncbi:MAG: phosphoribosylformylglycinamidine synthase subunit PurQ, partial [Mycoplasmoidaceae bacterium]|nr:phosphoribosylformylglycinamidine synthase subunit PurQ [Mycoplasmoidaceae bacterium]